MSALGQLRRELAQGKGGRNVAAYVRRRLHKNPALRRVQAATTPEGFVLIVLDHGDVIGYLSDNGQAVAIRALGEDDVYLAAGAPLGLRGAVLALNRRATHVQEMSDTVIEGAIESGRMPNPARRRNPTLAVVNPPRSGFKWSDTPESIVTRYAERYKLGASGMALLLKAVEDVRRRRASISEAFTEPLASRLAKADWREIEDVAVGLPRSAPPIRNAPRKWTSAEREGSYIALAWNADASLVMARVVSRQTWDYPTLRQMFPDSFDVTKLALVDGSVHRVDGQAVEVKYRDDAGHWVFVRVGRPMDAEDAGAAPRRNPPLGGKLADQVLRMDYVHHEDGKEYTHDFTEDAHRVEATVDDDGRRVTLRSPEGERIVEDF